MKLSYGRTDPNYILAAILIIFRVCMKIQELFIMEHSYRRTYPNYRLASLLLLNILRVCMKIQEQLIMEPLWMSKMILSILKLL